MYIHGPFLCHYNFNLVIFRQKKYVVTYDLVNLKNENFYIDLYQFSKFELYMYKKMYRFFNNCHNVAKWNQSWKDHLLGPYIKLGFFPGGAGNGPLSQKWVV